MTRKLMVEWCDHFVRHDRLPPADKTYLDHAILKKWISADKERILSAGWSTAARFLKR